MFWPQSRLFANEIKPIKFYLRLSSSYLVCSYLITTVQFSQYVSPPESEMLELFLDLRNIWVYQNDKIYSGTPSFDPKIVLL